EAGERSEKLGDNIGRAFAALGLARQRVLEPGSSPVVLAEARARAEEAETLLGKHSARPDWKATVKVWRGWAEARLATTEADLRRADEAFFLPAIADLRSAGLRVHAAQALFQPA